MIQKGGTVGGRARGSADGIFADHPFFGKLLKIVIVSSLDKYLRDLNNSHLMPKEQSRTCCTHLSESSTRLREPPSGDSPQSHKILTAMADFSTAHNHCLMQRL